MELSELIEKSGDSELVGYEYTDNILKVRMEVPDIYELDVELTIKTSCVRSRFDPDGGAASNTCYLDLVDLKDHCCLNENNIIVSPTEFGTLMQQARNGYNLAYGLRLSEAPYMLRFKGSCPLLVCIVKSLDDIQWEIIE